MSILTGISFQHTGSGLMTYTVPLGKRLKILGAKGTYSTLRIGLISLITPDYLNRDSYIFGPGAEITYSGGTYNGSDRTLIWYGILEDNI